MSEAFSRVLEIVLFALAGVWQGIWQDWNLFEIAVLAVVAMGVWTGRLHALGGAAKVERWAVRIARRRWGVCLAIGTAAIVIRLILLPVLPRPEPVVNDEFSHLLVADTLLQGRVSNPVHPFWEHFESLHILQRPRYVSNYFPGQGALLAASIWAIGSAWFGVVVSSGVFAAALCWALQGWMPPRWAMLGGVLAVLRFGIGSYWVNSYYGGFLAATGGALVAGAFARMRRRADWRLSLVLGSGLVLLAFSRPYEGFAFSIPFIGALLIRRERVRLLAPAMAVAGAGVVLLGVYDQRVTGSSFVTPYAISQREYGWPMTLAWYKPPVINHRHAELKAYYDYEVEENSHVRGPVAFAQYFTLRMQEHWRFYFGPLISATLFWAGWVFRRKRFRILLAGAGVAVLAAAFESAGVPHYIAPATVPLIAVAVWSIWRMRRVSLHGIAFSRVAVGLIGFVLFCRIAAQAAGLPYTQKVNYHSWCCKVQGRYDKARLAQFLEHQPGLHLVLVTAKTDPYNFFQWIHNAADIDGSRIVWARDMGEERNRRLLNYFAGRKVWKVDPNVEPAKFDRLR